MTKDTSGPAFPVQYSNESDGPTIMPTTGITIRQYAAIKAMQGLLANNGGPMQANAMCGWSLCHCTENDVAAMSVRLADALRAELEK